MEEIRNLQLKFKCSKSTADFQSTPEGFYCGHCNQNVYDFSSKSLDDLLAFFENHGGSFCGGFAEKQLKKTFSWSRLLTSVLLLLGIQASAQVQGQIAKNEPAPADTTTIKDFGGVSEILPKFPGGDLAFLKYIEQSLIIPPMTPEGRVVISFVVDKSGSLRDIEIAKGLTPQANAEAIRVISAGKKWSPGIYNGRPVNLRHSISIYFKERF